DGDDRLAYGVAQVSLGGFLELAQNHRGDFGRGELLVVDIDLNELAGAADDLVGDQLFFGLDFVVTAAHEALDGVNRAARVGDRLPFGRVADQAFALVG